MIVLAAVAVGAGGVILAIAPTVYERIRTEVLLRRLESGPDVNAWKALSSVRHADSVLERYLRADEQEPSSHAASRLACPLLTLAIEGSLPPSVRTPFFDRLYPFALQCQAIVPSRPRSAYRPPFAISGLPAAQVVVLLIQGDGAMPMDLGRVWSASPLVCPDPGPGDDLAQYVEYFVAGKGPESRLAYERSTWAMLPSAANRARGARILATEDLTDSPDPFRWFPCRPREISRPGERAVLELRFASRGSWRQYIPGMDRTPRAAAYSVALDRSDHSPGREQYPLGRVAIAPSGAWYAESALGGPMDNMDRGAHWVYFPVPESETRLEPFARIRLIFTPDPDYARSKGFEMDDLPPFTRDIFLPPWGAPWPPR